LESQDSIKQVISKKDVFILTDPFYKNTDYLKKKWICTKKLIIEITAGKYQV